MLDLLAVSAQGPIVVQKFGGSSVADVERLGAVAINRYPGERTQDLAQALAAHLAARRAAGPAPPAAGAAAEPPRTRPGQRRLASVMP